MLKSIINGFCPYVCLCIQEHKLMRNQSVGGSKLPDLSETAEQEKGDILVCPLVHVRLISTFSAVVKGGYFLNLRENLFQSENFFLIPPIH